MTDWLWEAKECEEQKSLVYDLRDHPNDFNTPEGRRRRDEFRLLSVSFILYAIGKYIF